MVSRPSNATSRRPVLLADRLVTPASVGYELGTRQGAAMVEISQSPQNLETHPPNSIITLLPYRHGSHHNMNEHQRHGLSPSRPAGPVKRQEMELDPVEASLQKPVAKQDLNDTLSEISRGLTNLVGSVNGITGKMDQLMKRKDTTVPTDLVGSLNGITEKMDQLMKRMDTTVPTAFQATIQCKFSTCLAPVPNIYESHADTYVTIHSV